MPNFEEHCQRTLKRYGVEGRDIHSWLDEPSKEYAGSHRQFRHDTETVRLVGELFGKAYGKSVAENIALDHIMADHEEEIKKRDATIIVNLPSQKEIPSIPCAYCKTLLKPSDQTCPKCGASRTKIIDEFDRATELEKLRLQKKKKELRKELKTELFYTEMTPLQRLHNLNLLRGFVKTSPLTVHIWTKHIEILERLIQEDLQKDPNLEQRYESMTKDQKRSIMRSHKF